MGPLQLIPAAACWSVAYAASSVMMSLLPRAAAMPCAVAVAAATCAALSVGAAFFIFCSFTLVSAPGPWRGRGPLVVPEPGTVRGLGGYTTSWFDARLG